MARTLLAIRIEPETKAKLARKAKEERRSLSGQAEHLIAQGLAQVSPNSPVRIDDRVAAR